MTDSPRREQWSSRTAFLLAVTGASVGLGNLWRFPYVAGENGGGAFVLVYLVFILVIGIPLVMAELAMGKRAARNPVSTLKLICEEEGKPRFWHSIGWFSILAPLLATTFYSVIAGWSLYYLFKALTNAFSGISGEGAEQLFGTLLTDPATLTILHTLYLAGAILVVGRGIRHGIERITKIMMPLLYLLLIGLAIYASLAGDAAAGWHFLFSPDFSKLTGQSVLMALGQALFSISVGTGALLTYGSYLSGNISVPKAAWTIGLVDTSTALLAGLAIFPIVFASGLAPTEGPGLMFVTLPIALGNMAGGPLLSVLFFALVFFAAFTSSLAMLEPFVAWLTEHKGYNRFKVACGTGLGVWLVGLCSLFSFNLLQDFKPLSMIPLFQERTIFSIIDFMVSNLMLPINALLIALFVGWALSSESMLNQIGLSRPRDTRIWLAAARYLAPTALFMVFIFNL